MLDFRIHGDNIVECERTLELIARSLSLPCGEHRVPTGSPLAPTYSLIPKNSSDTYRFILLPGYGRWDTDILEVIRRRGGTLREAADSIVCKVVDGYEEPLIAIEYCGALPAGNQAWQRNGRALSFAQSQLPYVYVAELSGYELDSNRRRKAARMPNPAVPFSYLLLSESAKSPAVPVFVRSPGASEAAVLLHTPFYGEEELLEVVRCTLLGEPTDPPRIALEGKVLALVKHLAGNRRTNDTLTPEQWAAGFSAVSNGGSFSRYLAGQPALEWSKTAYIDDLTASAKKLMQLTARFARGLTSTSLPMCIVPANKRVAYAKALSALYPGMKGQFVKWCSGEEDLAVCWVMGFKPGGDDARPDRGLPPLCRMLVGEKTQMLTVVYGPAPATTWPMLATNPAKLISQNGLWEAILACSDAVLIDSNTVPTGRPLTYLEEHWASARNLSSSGPFSVTPTPIRAGENDVDTVLHLLFARLGHPHVFEGLCNPPGGDWSGLSLLDEDRALEFRWLVLPRVTGPGSKRPDHVFQLFGKTTPYLVVAIESKERSRDVESGIGPRLRNYVSVLVRSEPSVERTLPAAWNHAKPTSTRPAPKIATIAAFAASSRAELKEIAGRAEVDLVLGFVFPDGNNSCKIWARSCTPVGEVVQEFLASLALQDLRITLEP